MSISKSIYPAKHIQMWRSSLISLLCMPFCLFFFLWRVLATACVCIDPIIGPVVSCDELHTLYQIHIMFHLNFEIQNNTSVNSKKKLSFTKGMLFQHTVHSLGHWSLIVTALTRNWSVVQILGGGADSESTLDVLNTALLLFLLSMPNAITTSTDSTRS